MEETKVVEEEETFDWTKVQTEADVEKEQAEDKKEPKKPKFDPYGKDEPFIDNAPLLIHKYLHEENHEYVFFVSDSGSKDMGIFIVLIEALTMYKKEK